MVGTNVGTIVNEVNPHIPLEVDLAPLTSAVNRISASKEAATAASGARYDKFLMQEHKGRWASEMSEAHSGLMDEYATLYAQGVRDPLKDPEARDFQKKVAEFETKRSQAEFLDKHLDATGKMVATNPDGSFSEESIADALSPVELGFDDLLDAKVAFPQKKQPMADLNKVIDVFSKQVYATEGDLATLPQIVKRSQSFVDAMPPDVANSLKTYYDRLGEDQKMELRREAAKQQLADPMNKGAMVLATAKLVDDQRKPFNFAKMQENIVSDIDPKKYSNARYSSFTNTKQVQDALELRGMAEINSDPRILLDPNVRAAMRIDADDSDSEARTKARAYFRGLHPLVKNQDTTMRAPRSEGGGSKDTPENFDSSMQSWLSDVMQINPERKYRALTHIDKKILEKNIPGVLPDESIDSLDNEGGTVWANLVDKKGNPRRIQVEVSINDEEMFKNMYREQYEAVKRHYKTTEMGSPPPRTSTQSQTATQPKKKWLSNG